MSRGKTLRRIKKISKKSYKGGQQQSLDYKDEQDIYASNLEKKKEFYQSIKKEGSQLYDVETSNKTDIVLEQVKLDVSFIVDFYSSKLIDFNNIRDDITKSLEIYGINYTSYFIPSLKEYQNYVNEAEELLSFAKQVQLNFLNKNIHIHLIQQRLNLLETIKTGTNDINKKIEKLNDSIKSIIKSLESEKDKMLQKKQAIIQESQIKKLELSTAIDTVKREYPEGFTPKDNSFIQGCPIGTVLENNECKYYNESTLIETVPIQEKLVNTDTSDWIIWFNNVTPSNVNDPTIFKRKPLQYLLRLTVEDAKYFDSEYVVSEQNGTPYKDENGHYKFVPSISETPINIPGFQKYYIDYDEFPQAVEIIEVESPKLRIDLTLDKYFCALNDIDQIISGIKYIETDRDGNLLNNNIIPFYPEYESYTEKEGNFTKIALNDIDTITYHFVKQFTTQIDKLINKSEYSTLTLDPYTYNLIPPFYKNKFTDISTKKYYNPFIFPQFFLEIGDYFMIQNSGTRPIIFNLSLNEEEKRMVLYPKQICCFVYSSTKENLRYGYLVLDRYIAFQTKSSKVAKYKDTYIFVENSLPLYDSEHNIISVPHFNEATKTYYEYDDIFETIPKQISEIVNLDLSTVISENISLEFFSYSSIYVTLCSRGNIYVFCDSTGNPLIDVLGYLIPVPSPLHYENSKFFWYSLEKKKFVTILTDYIGVISIDDSYDYSIQFNSDYFTNVNNIKVFINSQGFPLTANKMSYLAVPETSNVPEKQVQLFLPENFKITLVDTEISKNKIHSEMLMGLLNVYTQNTQMLEDNYKDISGNMNNFKELKSQLFNISNEIQLHKHSRELEKYELEAKEIYRNILKTNDNLQAYIKEQKQIIVYNSEIDKIISIRKNELLLARTKLDRIKLEQKNLKEIYEALNKKLSDSILINPIEKEALLAKFVKIPLDIKLLESAYDGLENTYNFVKTSVESSNTIEEATIQEQTINILLRGIITLEKNQLSEIKTLQDLKNEIEVSELNMRDQEKNRLFNLIIDEKSNIEIYKEKLKAIIDDKVQKTVSSSILIIENIIKNVESEQKTVVIPTVEIVDKKIDEYRNIVENSIPEQKGIILTSLKSFEDKQDESSSKVLIEQRSSLIERINKFKSHTEKVSALIDSLGTRISEEEKHRVEEELLENFNIVQEIEQTINTNTDIKSSFDRVDEIEVLNNKIQYDLQAIELKTAAKEPAPITETFVETNASPTPKDDLEVDSVEIIEPVQKVEEVVQTPQLPVPPPIKIGGRWKSRRNKQKKSRITRKLLISK